MTNYKWFEKGDYNLNIVGIRNSNTKGKVTNRFDDKIGLLKKIINWGLPLPFRGVGNKRSIISVETLANVVTDYVLDKVKWQGVELITDPQPLSTESIVSKLSQNSRQPVILFSVPKKIVKIVFTLFRRKMFYEKLFEDLVFESSQNVLAFVEKELK